MEKAKTFFAGQMVKCIPEYKLGSSIVPPDIIYPFKGIGIIIELEWPDKAHIYTTEGNVVCLNTDRLLPVKKEKK